MSTRAIKNFSIMVAMAENHAIGADNKLLWRLKDDLKLFKETTTGHSVLMGRKTFESIDSNPLPKRRNYIISQSMKKAPDGCILFKSVEEAISAFEHAEEEVFILGGGTIYEQMLPYCSQLYISLVHAKPVADTFFPKYNDDEWQILQREDYPQNDRNQYAFTFYKMKRK